MTNLTDQPQWDPVYQYETIDLLEGGPNGIDNLQGQQLANRTLYLKQILESLFTGPFEQAFSGLSRLMTPAGGARVREYLDVTNAATVGGIEIGQSYNCAIDLTTGLWAGRDVADICWLEKWNDAGAVKEIWYAATAAQGVVPAWVKMFSFDASTGSMSGSTGSLGDNTTKHATDAFVHANMRDSLRSVSASVAANALTVGLNPCLLDFRSATLNSGVPNMRTVANALSLTVPAGATLGTTAATAARLALLAIDNAGTVELAIANTEGGLSFDETGLISTTAISNAANSASVVYSAAARALVPYRLVGYVDITEAVAGTWATAPTVVQGNGGNAMPSGIASVLVGASFICIQLVGGLMIQAARMNSSATADVTWTYPVAFKRAVLAVVGNQNNNPSSSILVSAVPVSLTSCGLGSYVSSTGARSAVTQIAAIAVGI